MYLWRTCEIIPELSSNAHPYKFSDEKQLKERKAGYIFKTSSSGVFCLTITTLCAAHDKLIIFFLLFPENKIWHFMQIITIGEYLHELTKPVFWEKNKKN